MIQEVKLQGLTHSPSDHISLDGELGTCLNLINEDGELRPIHVPTIVDGSITIPDGATIELVHKVTHEQDIHSHYIVRRANGTFYWAERGGNGNTYNINLEGIQVNSVTAIGNIICFVGDNNIYYALWRGNSYSVFSRKCFDYSLDISSTQKYGVAYANMGEDYWNYVSYTYFSENKENNRQISGFTEDKMRKAFTAVDAIINKNLDEAGKEWLKGVAFGVAAVRLYDGSYINISNIFVLAPEAIAKDFYFRTDASGSDSGKYFKYEYFLHKDRIKVDMNIGMFEDLVQGVDIFITDGNWLLNIDKSYKNPTYTSSDTRRNGYVTLEHLEEKRLYEAIDGQSFYHALYIDKSEFGEVYSLKRPSRTEESISLDNFNRTDFGGRVAISYNNRLHVGGVLSGCFDTFKLSSTYHTRTRLFGKYLDLPLNEQESFENYDGLDIEIIAAITSSNNTARTIYNLGTIQYPIAPIITIPIANAKSAELYIKLNNSYYHKTIKLHQSNTFGASYFVNSDDDGNICMLQVNDVMRQNTTNGNGGTGNGGSGGGSINGGGGLFGGDDVGGSFDSRAEGQDSVTFKKERNNQWEDSDSDTWDRLLSLTNENQTVNDAPSLVRVSEAENPLVFPAKNSVQVGSSIISALASNTQPISEGQFGEAPLYAFTDEGVWVLMTSTEGTYTARQPANRDVCKNPKGILQIDDAVLYPTDRGIMLQQGKQSTCITESLDGFPFDFTKVYNQSKTNYNYPSQVLAIKNISDSSVQYVRFRDYMNGADMIYDYYDNRIIVFNTSYAYAYVYSLKSKMWGTMQNVFRSRVNIYPESYAVGKDGKILDVYVKSPSEDMNYIICTRPLSLNAKGIHKTMYTCIARGYARDGEQGKYGIVIFGSNDLFRWYYVGSSSTQYCRGMAGSPFKYFRVAIIGSLSVDETIDSLIVDIQPRWQNKVR